jgi:hypothetical protein
MIDRRCVAVFGSLIVNLFVFLQSSQYFVREFFGFDVIRRGAMHSFAVERLRGGGGGADAGRHNLAPRSSPILPYRGGMTMLPLLSMNPHF